MTRPFTDAYFESADGLRLHYRDYPVAAGASRTPVLCLPGLTRNCKDFESVATSLCADRRVVTPDMRGRGLSEYDQQWHNYHPQKYVEDVWQLLSLLGIDRTVVIGTSLGGLMAMLMVVQRSESVAGVVLNDVGPEIDPSGLERLAGYVGNLPTEVDWNSAAERTRQIHAASYPDLSDDEWLTLTEHTYREVDSALLPDSDRNIGVAFRSGISGLKEDPWTLFAALTHTPTLLLRGATSDILSAETATRMVEKMPDLVFITVPKRGHAPLLNELESINAIRKFLQDL